MVLLLAAMYFGFAAAVLGILALTDVTGFVTDVRSIAVFLALTAAALIFGRLGVRAVRRQA